MVSITTEVEPEVRDVLVRAAAETNLTVAAYVARLLTLAAHDWREIEAIGEGLASDDAP